MSKINNLIHTRDLAVGYPTGSNPKIVQNNLNVSLEEGEMCCLIGPNGVGKSTLLKTLIAQLKVIKGHLMVLGKAIQDYNQADLAKLVSVVLTEEVQVANLRVEELVAMGRFPYTNFWGKLNQDDHRIIQEAIALLEIEDLANRYFNELSDGEKQKVLIAKAIAQETPIIILDEPTVYLDFPSKVSIFSKLVQISHTKKIGVIISTHDLEIALKTADQIWLMRANQTIKTGIPEDLVLDGAIAASFSNEVLTFDLNTAHFSYTYQTKNLINCIGNQVQDEWLKRALVRKGISGDTKKKMDYSAYFRADKNGFILHKKEDLIGEFSNIQTLVDELLKTQKTKI
ncbi:MAG: ABC transporter ATP-binding protein [Bacteroidales bacterium]|nr:ABC transporter ATP-binding protein [Bacteroidales bacterium]